MFNVCTGYQFKFALEISIKKRISFLEDGNEAAYNINDKNIF